MSQLLELLDQQLPDIISKIKEKHEEKEQVALKNEHF